jgi:hypothetical protein
LRHPLRSLLRCTSPQAQGRRLSALQRFPQLYEELLPCRRGNRHASSSRSCRSHPWMSMVNLLASLGEQMIVPSFHYSRASRSPRRLTASHRLRVIGGMPCLRLHHFPRSRSMAWNPDLGETSRRSARAAGYNEQFALFLNNRAWPLKDGRQRNEDVCRFLYDNGHCGLRDQSSLAVTFSQVPLLHFISPHNPITPKTIPAGDARLHEPECLDGCRRQVVKELSPIFGDGLNGQAAVFWARRPISQRPRSRP